MRFKSVQGHQFNCNIDFYFWSIGSPEGVIAASDYQTKPEKLKSLLDVAVNLICGCGTLVVPLPSKQLICEFKSHHPLQCMINLWKVKILTKVNLVLMVDD